MDDGSRESRVRSLLDARNWESLAPLLTEMGFADPARAIAATRSLAEREVLRRVLPRLLPLCAESADPDQALHGLESLATLSSYPLDPLADDERALSILVAAFALSPYLTSLALAQPATLHWLFQEGGIDLTRRDFSSAFSAAGESVEDFAHLSSLLRRAAQREILRIALRDLGGLSPFEEVSRELSDLASACLDRACRFCYDSLAKKYGRPPESPEERSGFVVIGMGKLGGRELNFSSDVDLQYLHTTDEGETQGGPEGSQPVHRFYTTLSEMVTRALDEVTSEGFVFRVDLRLRPHGRSGRITNSLKGAEVYYESWGDTWERAALIKARPVAGDRALGEEFLRRITPFIYRRYLDFAAVQEIQEVKARLLRVRARTHGTLNLKYMAGGIRDIEFFVQALQLLYGGKHQALRESNTLLALQAVEELTLIGAEDHRCLREAYISWRTVEHRVQMIGNQQTHTIPSGKEEQTRLARAMGYRGAGAAKSFLTDVAARAVAVRGITERLFSRPSVQVPEASTEILALLEDPEAQGEVVTRLAKLGFRSPEAALQSLQSLSLGPAPLRHSERARRLLKTLAPHLLSEAAASPSPDQAVLLLEDFLERVGARTSFLALLAEHRETLTFLMRLFGTSFYLSQFFIRHPELLDTFVSAEASSPWKVPEVMSRELREELGRSPSYEEKLDALRRFHHAELLRVGLNDLYGTLEVEQVSAQLTTLAEVCLAAAAEMCRQELLPRCGIPRSASSRGGEEASVVILGLGALGAKEMTYHSDLDLIFIYSADGETTTGLRNPEYFSRWAQALISTLSAPTREGEAYQVDARLRPSGRFGPLVTSLEAFEIYHRERAQTWERQALLRARCVTGEPDLCRRIERVVEGAVYGRPFSDAVISEIHHLRERMRHELTHELTGKRNVKLGWGGLVEILFVVQLLQLQHGPTHPSLRTTHTVDALTRLAAEKLLPEESATALLAAYRFLRRLENGLRLLRDRSIHEFTAEPEELNALARHLYRGDPAHGGEQLLEEFERHTEAVRQLYSRLFRV